MVHMFMNNKINEGRMVPQLVIYILLEKPHWHIRMEKIK